MIKPIGGKSYGSIPHLPGSRTGPKDYHISEGQAYLATVKTRDKNDRVIIQEKLDGSNVSVARVGNSIYALTRSGYTCTSSPYYQHHLFAAWVMSKLPLFMHVLKDGERICGEWLAQAHGTIYKLQHEPFVAFDIMIKSRRIIYDDFENRVCQHLIIPFLVGKDRPMSVDEVMSVLDRFNSHNAVDPVEGAVWRVERGDKVDFLCKYVRPEKVDGKYLPENNNGKIIWNYEFE